MDDGGCHVRVMLCGEGAQDIGRVENWSINPGPEEQSEGWLQPLIRKALGESVFSIIPRKKLVRLPGRPAIKPTPGGHGAKSSLAKIRAIQECCDVLVFMVDADTTSIKDWKSIVTEVEAGFDAVDGDVHCVACVPLSTSESWLLSDLESWTELGANTIVLPKKPEQLWGERHDPVGNHPKNVFARTCKEANLDDCVETRSLLMTYADPAQISKKCGNSFPPFWERVCSVNT